MAVVAALVAAGLAAACALELRAFPDGELLARIPLAHDNRFALRYMHSVTLRPIESRYQVNAQTAAIVQVAELFDQHGPGMATDLAPGERLDTVRDADGVRFVMTMARPIERLVVRVQRLPGQTLVTQGRSLELIRFGERALELKPECM